MKKQKKNPFDELVENLSSKFSQIQDFEKLQNSEEGRRAFDFVVKSISEMETFEALFLNYYIPAANKSISDSWSYLRTSKYRNFLGLDKGSLKTNLYETVRLGYVGLFHKYESFLNSVIEVANLILREINEENDLLSVEDYCKKMYGVKLYKSHHLFSVVSKINYVANCVKHYDGMPHKKPINSELNPLDDSKRIEIEPEDFKKDITRLKSHCSLFISQILAMGFKQYLEQDFEVVKKSLKSELRDSPEAKEKLQEMIQNFNFILSDFGQPQDLSQ